MIEFESCIDRKYRLLLFRPCSVPPEVKKLNPYPLWKMECPLCGARKSTLIWMPSKSTWKFFCNTSTSRNCQAQMEFPILLKRWCPELFLSYQQERFEAGTTGAGFNCPGPTSDSSDAEGVQKAFKAQTPRQPRRYLNDPLKPGLDGPSGSLCRINFSP